MAHSQLSNYCPVFLNCICCKTLENIFYSHTMTHFQSNDVLSNAQHCFRKFCETQLIERVNDFVEITNEGGQTDVIALNL